MLSWHLGIGKRGLSEIHIAVSKRMDGAVVPSLVILYSRLVVLWCFCRSLSSCMARRYGRFHRWALLISSSIFENPTRSIAFPFAASGIAMAITGACVVVLMLDSLDRRVVT